MKLTTVATTGDKGSTKVSEAVFGVAMNESLLAQAIRVYRANQRQGTKAVKNRAAVNRTKRKWFKQKGTGNARHGARSAPIFVGGGVAHGPKVNQNWSLRLPTILKRKALAIALSAQAEQTFVVDAVEKLTGKTQEAASLMSQVAQKNERILVVVPELTDQVVRGLRNLPTVLVISAKQLSAWEVALANKIVITTNAIEVIAQRIADASSNSKKIKAKRNAKSEIAAEKSATKKAVVEKKAVKATPAKKAVKTAKTTVKKETKIVKKSVTKKSEK